MTSIFLKEFNAFLDSLIGYLVTGVFLVAIGLLMWVFPDTSVLDYGFADMDTLFSTGPYVLIFLVPAVTMRSFAEERKGRTLELLLTKPVSESEIVAGKFFAAFLLVIIVLLPTSIYCFSLSRLGNPPGNLDISGVAGSYIGLILLSGVFCAVGIFSSSITQNQIVSFVVAAFLCFVLYSCMDSAALLFEDGELSNTIRQLGILHHYSSISKGLIDSRDLVYFLTIAFAMLLGAKTTLSSRSW